MYCPCRTSAGESTRKPLKNCSSSWEQPPTRTAGFRVWLYNVNERIHILFGSSYGLTVTSEPDFGTEVTVKIPKLKGDDIFVPAQDCYQIESFIDGSIMTIADAPWPGLTPDLLSVMLVVATQAKGSVLIHQKMFESRLFFVDKLIDMGAQIILCDPHRAVVIGHNHGFTLRGGNMTSPDIRAGIALLIAAMSAEGISRIHNIEQIDRGYQNIEGRLNAIGARITRI